MTSPIRALKFAQKYIQEATDALGPCRHDKDGICICDIYTAKEAVEEAIKDSSSDNLSLRDRFAIAALQGVIAQGWTDDKAREMRWFNYSRGKSLGKMRG